jgi:hypothetical protein
MSTVVLPKEINYASVLPSLPDGVTNLQIALAPSSGQLYGENSDIIFDLPQSGSLVPSSMYLRYKVALTNNGAETSSIKGTPVFSFFRRMEVFFGSASQESLINYGETNHMLTNLTLSGSQKMGLPSYGYSATDCDANLNSNVS